MKWGEHKAQGVEGELVQGRHSASISSGQVKPGEGWASLRLLPLGAALTLHGIEVSPWSSGKPASLFA